MTITQPTPPAAPDRPPFVLQWGTGGRPLPTREVRPAPGPPARRGPMALGLEAPPWHESGPPGEPFDFCAAVRRLCEGICSRCPELNHVDVGRVLFSFTQARNARPHGLQARVTPLRFGGGQLTRRHRGSPYQVQRYYVDGREMLYVMAFCLPRFLDQSFDEKFVTLFHELYHICPAFTGDLRRHEGRYDVHSHSQKEYDEHMAHLAREYLAGRPDARLHGFLRLNFAQLRHRHGRVLGTVVPRPKLVPLPGLAG